MIYRCTESFTTREYGFPREIEEGSVWYMKRQYVTRGGYECAEILRIENGVYTADYARVRLERLNSNCELVPLKECVGLPRPDIIAKYESE